MWAETGVEMSNDDQYEDDDQPKIDPVRAQLKRVEKERDTLKADAAKASDAIRELGFLKAGVDTNAPAAKYFLKAYDGELTPDAIRAAAIEANIIAAQTDPALDAEKLAQQKIGAANKASESLGPPPDLQMQVSDAKSLADLDRIVLQAKAAQSL